MPPAGHTYRLRLAYEFQQRLHCCRARRSPMALEKSAGTSCRRAKLAVSPTAWVSQGFSSSSQASTNIFVLNPPSRTVRLHIWHLTCVGRRVTTVVWVCSSISRLLLPPPHLSLTWNSTGLCLPIPVGLRLPHGLFFTALEEVEVELDSGQLSGWISMQSHQSTAGKQPRPPLALLLQPAVSSCLTCSAGAPTRRVSP
jgi:hypothetical protein